MKQPKNDKGLPSILALSRLKALKEQDRRILVLLATVLLLAMGISFSSNRFNVLSQLVDVSSFAVGRPAVREVTAGRDLVFVDEEATRLKREAARDLVPPIFIVNEEISLNSLKGFDAFRARFLELLEEEGFGDAFLLKVQMELPGILNKDELRRLASFPMPDELLQQARNLLEETLAAGVFSLPDRLPELFARGILELWTWEEDRLVKREVPLERLITQRNLDGWLDRKVEGRNRESADLLKTVVRAFVRENCWLDSEQTEKYRQKAALEVEPVLARLVKGQVIVRKGDIVTEKILGQLKALGGGSAGGLIQLGGTLIFLLLAFGLGIYIFAGKVMRTPLKRNQIAIISGFGIAYLAVSAAIVPFFSPGQGIPKAVGLPTAAATILITLIISTEVGVLSSLLLPLLALPITGLEAHSLLFALLSGLGGTAMVHQVEKRIEIIQAGFLLSLLNAFIAVAPGLLPGAEPPPVLPSAAWGFLNGVACLMLSLGILPILEHYLRVPTRFRLRELSDLNAPIMKRMLTQAPGTYTHSISVANLAESACSAIGANALLARVGGFYHDIGKIDQAEYFIENQRSANKHDDLKPSLSAAVIKSHVKIGIEKARELKLPDEIIDIIAHHHGRGVIKYFYHRALKHSNGDNPVSSGDYSYPGDRPRSREAAVVMLADSVEAASRSLRKPTIAKIEKFVESILMEKFTSKELSHSELSFSDLEVIGKSFVQILAGYFHSRIEYPRIKEASP